LPAIIIGALVGILVYTFFFGNYHTSDLAAFLQYGTQGGLLGGLWRGPVSAKGSQSEHRHMWRKRLAKRLVISASFGLLSAFALGLHLSSYFHYSLSQLQPHALYLGVVKALSIFFLLYFLTTPFHPSISSGNNALRPWQRVLRFWSAIQGTRALVLTVLIGLGDTLTIAQFYEPSIGLRLGLSFGVIYGLISLALTAQMEDIRPTERLRWSWRSLKGGLLNVAHLRITLLLTGISMIHYSCTCLGERGRRARSVLKYYTLRDIRLKGLSDLL
jgi:hypothetical protein